MLDWKTHSCRKQEPSCSIEGHVQTALIGWPMHMSTHEEKRGYKVFKRLRADYLPKGDLVNDDLAILRNVWNALSTEHREAWKKKAKNALMNDNPSDEVIWAYFVGDRKDGFIKVDREYYNKRPEELMDDRSAVAQVWRNMVKSERMYYVKMARNEKEEENKSPLKKHEGLAAHPELKRELEVVPLTEKEQKHLGYLEFLRTNGAVFKDKKPTDSLLEIIEDIFQVIPTQFRDKLEAKAIASLGDSYEAILMREHMLAHYVNTKLVPHPTNPEDADKFEDNSQAARVWGYMHGGEVQYFIDKALKERKEPDLPTPKKARVEAKEEQKMVSKNDLRL